MTRHAFIITGSRDWTDIGAIQRVLAGMPGGALMIVGGAKGADSIAEKLWTELGEDCLVMPAQWERFGKAAGMARNREMLTVLCALTNCGYTGSVEAFSLPQSKGTPGMKRIAANACIPVHEHGRTE